MTILDTDFKLIGGLRGVSPLVFLVCLIFIGCRSSSDVVNYSTAIDTIENYITYYDTIRYVDSSFIKIKNFDDTLIHIYEYHHISDFQKVEEVDSSKLVSNEFKETKEVVSSEDENSFNFDVIIALLFLCLILYIIFRYVRYR